MRSVLDYIDYKYQFRRNPLKLPRLFFRHIKFCWQRYRMGYCDGDLWDIGQWFLEVVPDMLARFKDTRHGSPGTLGEEYVNEKGIVCNDSCHEEWTQILEQMIFLFREANEETCQRNNPLDKDYDKAFSEFTEKYGWLGEKLEKYPPDKGGSRRVHFMDELPEYKELSDKYHAEQKKLYDYQDSCKNLAFELFSKWFWCLWD